MSSNNITTSNGDWNPPYQPIIQANNCLLNNRFIVSLAVSDLIIGVEGIPFFTIYVINGDLWPLGALACEIWLFLDYTLCLISILTVLLITVDRYLSVCHTASYIKWQTPMRTQLLIFGSWILPSLIFGLMIFGWPLMGSIEDQIQATTNGECYAPFLANPFVNMSMYLAYYWTTLIAMLILYKGIHKAAKKLEKRSKAREHRHIALLLTQRLGTQVGVGLMLHARRYQEEALNTKKQQQPTIEIKDSGYTTNNTLSTTTETTERRRSSFAILVKAVQTSQRFRGRGLSVFNSNTSSVKEDNTTTTNNNRRLLKIQTPQLERLSEDNNSLIKTTVEINAEEEQRKLLNTVADGEDQLYNAQFFAIDAEDIDVLDDFPKDIHIGRLISFPYTSLSTEVFHEESLTSLLNFCPSMIGMTPSDNEHSISSSEIKNKDKMDFLNLSSSEKRLKRHNSLNALSRSFKNQNNIMRRSNSLGRQKIDLSTDLSIYAQIKHARQTFTSQKHVSSEESLVNKRNSDNIQQQCLSLAVPLKLEENQQKTSDSPTNSSNASSSRRRRERRPTTRKRQYNSVYHRSQNKKQQKGPQSYIQVTAEALGRFQQQFSGLILSGLGLTNKGNDERILKYGKQNLAMHFSPFSSFSSFSSSTQPTTSKNTNVISSQQQKQVPTLLVTRHSLTPQNIENVENKENQQIEEENNLEQNNQSSKFLQTLFSPISLFQKRRKKTKAERRAQKAFRTITFIVGLFAILWSPYYVVATVYGFCRGSCIPMFLYNLSYYMCYLNSSLNPFAYALANRQFRSAFWKILRGNFRKTS
uniref:G_PROTEIN_RECEP_F1_2 domain-containing protein n=1 Tax=Meloidogyne hapla TaxID=6305 RepID=A0A1I8B5P3_MELHA